MATFNASSFKLGTEIAPYVSAIPYIEFDESSVRRTPTSLQGNGKVYEDGIGYQVQFTYFGQFSYSSQQSFLNSYVTGFNLASPSLGGVSAQGFRIQAKDLVQDPNAAAARLLQGDDDIIGSAYEDDLNGGAGDDIIRGGGGSDRLTDGACLNLFYGGTGKDSFYVQQTATGRWVQRPSNTDSVWYSRQARRGGRRVKEFWVDNNYDTIADYNSSDADVIFFRGGLDGYAGEDVAGGLALFVDGTDNVAVFIENMTLDQFKATGLVNSW